MIKRRLTNASVTERLTEANFTGMQGINVSKSPLDKNYVLDALNFDVDLDNGLRLRKPIILSKEIVDIDSSYKPLGYLWDNETFIYVTNNNIYYGKTGKDDKTYTLTPLRLYFEKDGNQIYTEANGILFDKAEVLNTGSSSFITNIAIEIQNFAGGGLYDEDLYSTSTTLIYRYGKIEVVEGEYRLIVLQPSINTTVKSSDTINLNPNLMLDNPYAFRDNYTAGIVSVQGILAYTMTAYHISGKLVPTYDNFPSTVKMLTETVNKSPKASIVSSLETGFSNKVCLKAFLNIKKSEKNKYICIWEKTYNGVVWEEVPEFTQDATALINVSVPNVIESKETLTESTPLYTTKRFKLLNVNDENDLVSDRPDCLILNKVDDATFRFSIYTLTYSDTEAAYYNIETATVGGQNILTKEKLLGTSAYLIEHNVYTNTSVNSTGYLSCNFEFNVKQHPPISTYNWLKKFKLKITYIDTKYQNGYFIDAKQSSFIDAEINLKSTSPVTVRISTGVITKIPNIDLKGYLYKCIPVKYEVLYDDRLYYEVNTIEFFNNYVNPPINMENIRYLYAMDCYPYVSVLNFSKYTKPSSITTKVVYNEIIEYPKDYDVKQALKNAEVDTYNGYFSKYVFAKFPILRYTFRISEYLSFLGVDGSSDINPFVADVTYKGVTKRVTLIPSSPPTSSGYSTWKDYKDHRGYDYEGEISINDYFDNVVDFNYIANVEVPTIEEKITPYINLGKGTTSPSTSYEKFLELYNSGMLIKTPKIYTDYTLGNSTYEPYVSTGLQLAAEQYYTLFTDETEVLYNDLPSPAKGFHLYYNHRIYNYGSGEHKNSILVSDSNSIIFSMFNIIDLNTVNDTDINIIIPWRDYLIAANDTSTYLITKVQDGFTSKIINTFIGIPLKDRESCKSILNGIVFKSGTKIYSLQPNPYSSNDTILNIAEISIPVSSYVSDTKSFAFTTEKAYYLFMPNSVYTDCLKYEYSRKIWSRYNYYVEMLKAHIFNVNDIRLITQNKEFYFDKELKDVLPDVNSVSGVDLNFWLPNLRYGDIFQNWSTFSTLPIDFKLDSGQKTNNISSTKQFVESKFLVATLHEKDYFPMSLDVLIDGIASKIHLDVNTDSPFWKTKDFNTLNTLSTNFFTDETELFNVIRQMFIRYSCKGKTIKHIISGSSMYNFKLYAVYYRYRETINKQ